MPVNRCASATKSGSTHARLAANMSHQKEETTLANATRLSLDLPSDTFTVTVAQGVDEGVSFLIERADPTRFLVGTSPACKLRLTDRKVSRRHLALESTGTFLQVTDLNSTNGTTVNGLRIASALLTGSETVVIGSTSLRVQASGSSAAR